MANLDALNSRLDKMLAERATNQDIVKWLFSQLERLSWRIQDGICTATSAIEIEIYDAIVFNGEFAAAIDKYSLDNRYLFNISSNNRRYAVYRHQRPVKHAVRHWGAGGTAWSTIAADK